jgi:hypothetical protein
MNIEEKKYDINQLPLLLRPENHFKLDREDLPQWLKENDQYLNQQLKEAGAIIFRDFSIGGIEDFRKALLSLDKKTKEYSGGAKARLNISKEEKVIYIPTSAPKFIKNQLHSEMAYRKDIPSKVILFVKTPAKNGGHSLLGDNHKIFLDLDKDLKERWQKKKIKFTRYLPSRNLFHRFIEKWDALQNIPTWQGNFNTENKQEVENQCKETGHQYTWLKNNSLKVECVIDPIQKIEDKEYWINNAIFFDPNPRIYGHYLVTMMKLLRLFGPLSSVSFGDGEPISREDFNHIIDIYDKNTIEIIQRPGDIIYIDNLRFSHGRTTFKGNREVFFAQYQ